jgi:hypothetical protein
MITRHSQQVQFTLATLLLSVLLFCMAISWCRLAVLSPLKSTVFLAGGVTPICALIGAMVPGRGSTHLQGAVFGMLISPFVGMVVVPVVWLAGLIVALTTI